MPPAVAVQFNGVVPDATTVPLYTPARTVMYVPAMLAVEVKVWPAVAPVIWLYSCWYWHVVMVYVTPGAGATKEVG